MAQGGHTGYLGDSHERGHRQVEGVAMNYDWEDLKADLALIAGYGLLAFVVVCAVLLAWKLVMG